MKCDKCLNSRPVMSENGLHRVCGLRDEDEAMECLMGKVDHSVILYLDSGTTDELGK